MSRERRDYAEFLAAVAETFGSEVAHVTAVLLEKGQAGDPAGDETAP